MLLGIFGDTQINDHPPHDQVNKVTQRSTRFDEGTEITEKVVDAMAAAGAQGVLHLGDWTEHKDPTRLENLAISRILNRGIDKGLFWYGLAGNHDGAIFDQTSSSIEHFGVLLKQQMKYYHRPEVDTELGMLAVPYLHGLTPEQVKEQIELAYERARLTGWKPKGPLFGAFHYGAKGSVAGFDNRDIQGDYLAHDQILVEPLDHAFGGHIHKAQDFEIQATLRTGVCATHWWHPGSVVTQNIGERADGKQWILFDTATRKVIRQNIVQPRKFLVVPYSPALAKLPEEAKPLWGPEDIVQLQGEFSPGDHPADTMAAAYKLGVPMPFSMDLKQVRPAKSARAAAALEISTEGGMHEALQSYVRAAFPNNSGKADIIGPATQTVLDLLEESGLKTYAPTITPIEMELTDILTARKLHLKFKQGVAVIITGENGVGKSNSLEGLLWVQHGETSKGMTLAGVVNRNSLAGSGWIIYEGNGPEGPSRFRITRSIKLNKDLKAAQKLTLDRWDGKDWASLSDGGVPEIQKLIDQLVGGSFQSVKTTAFSFQQTTMSSWDSFLAAHPTERKSILGEVLGLTPLYLAHKELDKRRLAVQREYQTTKDNLAGRVAVAEDQEKRVADLQQQLATAEAEAVRIEKEMPEVDQAAITAQADDLGAKADLEKVRAQLNALPNTAATVSANEEGLATYRKTYEEARTKKLARWAELKVQIQTVKDELALMKLPADELMKVMEAQTPVLAQELKDLQAVAMAALLAQMGEKGKWHGYTESLKQLGDDKKAVDEQLLALGVAGDAEPLRQQLVKAQLNADSRAMDLQGQAAEGAKHTAAAVQAKKDLDAAVEARKAYEGQDVGKCSRCGRELDDQHVQEELARIDKETAAATKNMLAAADLLKSASAEIERLMGLQTEAKDEVKKLTDEIQAVELKAQAIATTTKRQAELAGQLAAAQLQLDTSTTELAKLEAAATAASAPVPAARAAAEKSATDLQALKDSLAAAAEAQGRLATLTQEDSTNDKDKGDDEAAHIVEEGRILAAIDVAKQLHTQNEFIKTALQSQVTAKQVLAGAAATALTTAMVKQQALKGALTTATLSRTSTSTALADIEAAKQANLAALLELGMLEQKLAIIETACKLVDPKTGLPAHLVDRYLPFLEDRMNFYMDQLGRASLSVAFTPFEDDKDSLAVMINDGKRGRAVEIRGYSGGQLGRIEWSLKFAMADLVRQVRGVTLGLMCCDEPTGGLDDAGVTMLITLLKQRVATYPVTMIISHDEEMIRSFDQALNFSEGAGGETVVA